MSLFRKPKKPIQRRVFSGYDDEDEENGTPSGKDPPSNGNENGSARQPAATESGLAPEGPAVAASAVASSSELRKRKEHRADASSKGGPGSLKATPGITKPSLLSFDDEEEGEVFQVKKSSHSKKVMKTLDKERRRKRHMEKSNGTTASTTGAPYDSGKANSSRKQAASPPSTAGSYETDSNDKIKREKCENSSSNIQTEIRTDDFVLVVKKSDPQNMILNGRAALCAGRNDMSSEEEETNEEEDMGDGRQHHHRFAKPQDDFKMYLENGVIPDAAMIHAARKRRQKAREQGEFIPIEEPKEEKNKKRTVQEDGDGDGSDEDDDRIDMSAITGAKEREERREQFYAVQREDSDAEDSDIETKEWENQQIRKGVTGAQLVSAQQESVISQYLIGSSFSQTFQNKSSTILQEGGQSGGDTEQFRNLSTAALLEKAYAASGGPLRLSTSGHKHRPNAATAGGGGSGLSKASDTKPTGPRMPQQILAQLTERQRTTEELNRKHDADIEHITQEVKLLGMDYLACEQKAPVAAAKYRFYQEFRCYVADLVECLNEKVPLVTALEQRALQLMAKHSGMLIERRRQDMRDQAKEVTDASKMIKRTGPDDHERVRRAAEREGRRTRRRRDREKNETADSHFDGMSSDDEIPDMEAARYRSALQEIELEARQVFADAAEEYGEVAGILGRFEQWRQRDMPAYSDAYVSLCLPKILAPLIRLEHVCWNPLTMEAQVELESEQWYRVTAGQFCCQATTEAALAADPDVRLIPTLVEKIFLPKLAALVEQYWDPLSTTQTFRLVRLLKRFVRDYPSLRVTCKPLRVLFQAILDKLKQSIDNDVFIPIFPKQAQEAKSSFFQRQFCSGLKLLRNITSWQGILADAALKELAIGSLLNRYLLNGMRVCTPVDAIAKASTVVYTLPRVWLSPGTSVVQSMEQFVNMLKHLQSQLDPAIPQNGKLIEQISKLLSSLHVVSPKSVASTT